MLVSEKHLGPNVKPNRPNAKPLALVCTLAMYISSCLCQFGLCWVVKANANVISSGIQALGIYSALLLNRLLIKGVVTNYGEGGLQNRRGGHVKFYPYEKGGAEKVLAILKGGAQKVLG